ncbi:DNA polymerase IV [Rhodococcus sp. X156]|uniref:DNA polymerase IV n=1 Tax=Rhodococcus sp. X156 TaxID=2499145 RepID=UPI0013E40F96|nr:DNA polymerase IV [Rhodococcus sp. X156]
MLIVHVDADAFFASVEQRQKPSLAHSPVIVGGLGPRGVVATASYEARHFGVGSAMSTATALRRCPSGMFLSPRMRAYREHSAAIMAVLRERADVLEQVSIDEAYLQVTLDGDDPREVVAALAEQVWLRTGLRVSVGAGASKLVAKLAAGAAKPRGVRVVTRAEEQAFLDALPVSALPGVGPIAQTKLAEVGVRTVAELRVQQPRSMERLLGVAAGHAALALAHGQDTRPVAPGGPAKSISAERTMDFDVPASRLDPVLDHVLAAAHTRLVAAGVAARTVTVRLRDAQFVTIGRSVSLGSASAQLGPLRAAARDALQASISALGLDAEEESGAGARLLGVALSALTQDAQLSLLPDEDTATADTTLPEAAPAAAAAAATPPQWPVGTDVAHDEHGRGWVVRHVDAEHAPSGHAEVVVRFEEADSRTAVQRRFAVDDTQLRAVDPAPVRPPQQART